ncbi:NACHT domain-containing protein [Ascidiaceihabitans sp.]|uniref:NACHT domain-containing protein n=1 Tax=Ascidiaceihabitans sp. TaxID=1872644 RepID=UPI0032993ADB
MSSEIDPNAVVVGVASNLIGDFFKNVIEFGGNKYSKAMEKLFPQFESHLLEVHKRVSSVKVLCSPDAPTDFSSIYVCPTLRHKKDLLDDNEFMQRVRDNERLVVKSQGGAGKSFLMRNIWLSIFGESQGKVPILIELRGLNDPSETQLETYIRATAVKTSGMSAEVFRQFCDQGAFTFLLDGFDEVERETRPLLEKQILTLARSFPDCGMVVTGRPDDRFASWSDFQTFECRPFSFEQFRELMAKVPFEETSKNKFLKVADEEFFDKHSDFLSNPLLSLMMLMTYKEHAEIPSSLSVFYENCYLTLFSRHDAMKEQFSREKLLNQSEFRRVFSIFCYFSYLKSKQDFTEGELYTFVEAAGKHGNCAAPVEDLIHEFLETVNLLYKDGLKYWFVHRSFQEYFAAYCVTNVLTTNIETSLELFADRRMDNTLKLASEMHPDMVSERYLLPKFHGFEQSLQSVEKKATSKNFAALHFLEFELSGLISERGAHTFGFSWSCDRAYEVFVGACQAVLSESIVPVSKELHKAVVETHDMVRKFYNGLDEESLDAGSEGHFSLKYSLTGPIIVVDFAPATGFESELAKIKQFEGVLGEKAVQIGRLYEKYYRTSAIWTLNKTRRVREKSIEKASVLANEYGI